MSFDNPFYHRGAIRQEVHFQGRNAETSQILGLLRNGQSVSVIGPRRIGKSSLLIHLCRTHIREAHRLQPPQALFVLIDCQELGGSLAEEVYDAIHTGLLDAATTAGIDLSGLPESGTYRALDRTLHHILQNDAGVVLLLDEFELLAANEQLTPYFFARLRGLTTKYGLAYITASQRPLYAITADEEVLSSPFFNIFVTMQLGLFSAEDAYALMKERLRNAPIKFDDELIDCLITLVGPHPFFLHVAGYHAFQAIASAESDTDISFTAIQEAIEVEAESHLSYLWNNLNSEEQYTLATADGPIDILRMLEQQCLLQSGEDGYNYTGSILRRFVRRQQVAGLIQADPFVIDPQRHQVKVKGREISLTTSQFQLLTCLSERAGQVVHGDDLERAVWGDVLLDDPDRLKTLIKRLRRALEPYGNWIVSERGVGYALRPPE
ncbi:MAG: winged helix-turn-helix domain-containing protein [Anaerolineae bacterium]|nr:winged helix-turn-helix domain-containing protein [Anaerolineae bacterium]MCO5196562.1 winged helix-turn-helix domain-containing protein [Anaerolineae bacterium]